MRFRATEEKVPKLAKACARRLLPCQSANRLASLANRWSRIARLASKRGARPVVGAKRKELSLAAPFLQSEQAVPRKQQVGSLPSKLLACDDFQLFWKSPGYLCRASIDCDIILGRVNLVVRKAERRT
jgi:hypothetical protein